MKAYLFVGAAIASALLTIPAQAQLGNTTAPNQLYVNGQRTGGEVAPRILGNTVYVPLRIVTDYLGGGATWDNAKQTATLKQGIKLMTMTVGQNRAMVNGEGRALTAPVRIQEGRVLLPLRDVANLLGAQVTYNQSSGAVFLTVASGVLKPVNSHNPEAPHTPKTGVNLGGESPTRGTKP